MPAPKKPAVQPESVTPPAVQPEQPNAEATTRLAYEAATAAFTASQAQVGTAKAAAEAMTAESFGPGEYELFEKAHDKTQFDLAQAVKVANFCSTQQIRAKAAYDVARNAQRTKDDAGGKVAADFALRVFATGVPRAAESLAEGLAVVLRAVRERDAIRAEVQDAVGLKATRDEGGSLALVWPELYDKRPGNVGLLATALNVCIWVEGEPARQAIKKRNAEQHAAEVARQHEDAALRGEFGDEERAAAQLRQQAELRTFYRPLRQVSLHHAGSPSADPDVRMYERNQKLADASTVRE